MSTSKSFLRLISHTLKVRLGLLWKQKEIDRGADAEESKCDKKQNAGYVLSKIQPMNSSNANAIQKQERVKNTQANSLHFLSRRSMTLKRLTMTF